MNHICGMKKHHFQIKTWPRIELLLDRFYEFGGVGKLRSSAFQRHQFYASMTNTNPFRSHFVFFGQFQNQRSTDASAWILCNFYDFFDWDRKFPNQNMAMNRPYIIAFGLKFYVLIDLCLGYRLLKTRPQTMISWSIYGAMKIASRFQKNRKKNQTGRLGRCIGPIGNF